MVSDLAGRRVGLHAPRTVEAVAVSAPGEAAARARRLVARSTPVLARPDGALVLFPLSPPEQVARDAARLRSAFGDGSARRLTVSVGELARMARAAPLAVEAGHGADAPEPAGPGDLGPVGPERSDGALAHPPSH
jgi:hypothetical protein